MRAGGLLCVCALTLTSFGAGCRYGFDDVPPSAELGCLGTRGPQLDLADASLLGYWSFNERVMPVHDHSGRGNDATFTGANISFTQGGIGAALKMDGVDAARAPASPAFDVGDGDFTVEVWARVFEGCSPAKQIVARTLDGAGWVLACNPGGLPSFSVATPDGNDTVVSLVPVNDGKYHHVAGVRRNGQLELWIDGETRELSGNTVTGSADVAAADITIGAALGADLDDVRLWSVARDPADITRAAYSVRPGQVAYWTFDQDGRGFAGLGNDSSSVGDVGFGRTGRAGNAVDFAAAGGRVEVAMSDVFAADYSALAWFRTSAGGGMQQLLDRESATDSRAPLHVWVSDGEAGFTIRSTDGSEVAGQTAARVADECWHHIAVVRTGIDMAAGIARLYIDGELALAQAGTFGTTSDGTDPLRLGFRLISDPRAFRGTIDEVQVYDRALDDAEVRGIYSTLR